MKTIFLHLLAFLDALAIVVLPCYIVHQLLFDQRPSRNSARKPIKAHIVYLNHTVEEVQMADADTMEEVVRKRLTAKLTASPDMDVSTLVVCREPFKGFCILKLLSANISSDPAEAPILTEAASGTIEFRGWKNKKRSWKLDVRICKGASNLPIMQRSMSVKIIMARAYADLLREKSKYIQTP